MNNYKICGMEKTKLYIDIDGVLLKNREDKAVEGISSFIRFIVSNFDCYWLTTHCKGDAQQTPGKGAIRKRESGNGPNQFQTPFLLNHTTFPVNVSVLCKPYTAPRS